MMTTQNSTSDNLAAPSRSTGFFVTMASSIVLRLLLALAITIAFALVARPSMVIAVLLLVSAVVYIVAFNRDARVLATLRQTVVQAAPCLGLFVLAVAITIPTAFNPLNHVAQLPKVLGLQLAVLLFFCLGRSVGAVPLRTLMWWVLAFLAASTVLLLEEHHWFLLRSGLLQGDAFNPANKALLNRSLLLVTIALSFFLVSARDQKSVLVLIAAAVLLTMIWTVTLSESAKLVVLIAIPFLVASPRFVRVGLTFAVVGAVALMLIGPFVYAGILDAWKAGPLAGYRIGTFLYRLETYADFAALIRDSNFLGRGLSVSKLIAVDPSLFRLPNNPCGAGQGFCPWHPHNAGLELAADLGIVGVAWLASVLWRVRSFILGLAGWQQRGVAAMTVGFLAVSFVADGLWQTWWWSAAAIFAMWIGILSVNPQAPDRDLESTTP